MPLYTLMCGYKIQQEYTFFSVLTSLGIRSERVVLIQMDLCKKYSQGFPKIFLRNVAEAVLRRTHHVSVPSGFFFTATFFTVSK